MKTGSSAAAVVDLFEGRWPLADSDRRVSPAHTGIARASSMVERDR
ncbi:MAG TPA: hypothetical protein VLT81_06360 [Chondromyces sp.]|nr:hypothetical protein [Chondromyces sp.]